MPVKSMNGEIWKDVPNYEGYYQASNIGRVRSLDRIVTYSNGYDRFYKGRVIKGNVNKEGYRQVSLSFNGKSRSFMFSQIIAVTFLGHKPNGHTLVVDHINGDKSDNRVENLRIATHRANSSTCFRSDRSSFSSEYIGVHWHKKTSKWQSKIKHNGADVHLGYYDTEIEASKAYQLALSKIKDGSFNHNDYKPKWTSEYKGVSFYKRGNKWRYQISVKGKQLNLGYFLTELEAHKAYQAKLKDIQTI